MKLNFVDLNIIKILTHLPLLDISVQLLFYQALATYHLLS
jgi:hypothetical protein